MLKIFLVALLAWCAFSSCSDAYCVSCPSSSSICAYCRDGYGVITNKCYKCSDAYCNNCDGSTTSCK